MAMGRLCQIAIDGPAASGKSTVARIAAARLGAFYVNTGEMYRALALACLGEGLDPASEPRKVAARLAGWDMTFRDAGNGSIDILLNGNMIDKKELRTPEVTAASSSVARIPEVREYMLQRQRDCRSLGTIIMEGRDICTVVLPDATAKFFITATPLERGRRRLAQGEAAPGATLESVAAEIEKRDLADSTRSVAPLRPAEDAEVIVTDGMTAEEVADRVLEVFRMKAGCAEGGEEP